MSPAQIMTTGWSATRDAVQEVVAAFREPTWSPVRRTLASGPQRQGDRMDWILFLLVAALLVFGLTMVFSSSSVRAALNNHDPFNLLMQQALRGGVGLVLMLILARIDYRVWQGPSFWLAAGTFLLLLLVLIPGIGQVHKGAQRWLSFGPVSIQPTEFARIGCILLMARLLARHPSSMPRFHTGPLPAFLVALAFVAAIIKQPSLGSSLALGLTAFAMCFVARMRWKHIGLLIGSGVALAAAAIGLELIHGYQLKRWTAFLNLWRNIDDKLGATYQLRQSILAIGSGGLSGKGVGNSEQKWLFLPDAHTDFIFSIVGEELGFIGAFGLLVLLALFVWRGLRIASEAEEPFGMMLAAGISMNFAIYAIINVAVTMALMPTTGLPLPFMSYGGSALLANLMAVGLLLSVARHRTPGVVIGGDKMRRR